MAKAKKPDDIGGKLETAINAMLKKVADEPDLDAELKLKILDRGLKYWAIKNKVRDDSLGAGFRDDDNEQENE